MILFFLLLISFALKKASVTFNIKGINAFTVLSLVIGIVIAVGALTMKADFDNAQSEEKQFYLKATAETPARVLEVERFSVGIKQKVASYKMKYAYQVNGLTYEASSDSAYPLEKGSAAKACYNPANPEQSYVTRNESKCGGNSE